MKSTNKAPFTHGMEIEQFPDQLPADVRSYTMSNAHGVVDGWHWDASGPRETSIGPFKHTKAILDRFFADTVDQDITWSWHAASDGGSGAGSHVHLCMAPDVFDEEITAWTIAYNTVVELAPFLAPYWCHDWENGFRSGGRYGRGQSQIEHWATPTLARASTATIRDHVERPHGFSRTFDSVTFNPAQGEKPVTIELRLNDAHPAMALNGLTLLRRTAGQAIEGGWSPKLEDHNRTLGAVYDKIYSRAQEVGLLTAMQEPIEGGIRFMEGRGIPGVEQLEFETPFDVLRALQAEDEWKRGEWRHRGVLLVAEGEDANSPARPENVDSLWNIDADVGEFAWGRGPETEPNADVQTVPDSTPVEDLDGVGKTRAEALHAAHYHEAGDLRNVDAEWLADEVDGVGEFTARKILAQVI